MSTPGPVLQDDVEVDLDDAHDLDARDIDAPGAGEPRARGGRSGSRLTEPAGGLVRWPDSAPAWVRGPGAVLGAVVLTAALVGGLVSHQAGARLEQEVAARTALLSLAVGSVELEGVLTGSVSVRGSGTAGETGLAVTLVNRGELPVQVQLTGLSAPGSVGAGAADPVVVGAEGTEGVRLPLRVDCAEVAGPTSNGLTDASAGSREWLTALVGDPGAAPGGREERLPISQPRFTVTDQLAWACEQEGPQGPEVTGVPLEVGEDGGLVVRVANDSSQAVLVIPQDALGAELLADPPLPVRVPAGERVVLGLRLEVDCARVDDVLALSRGTQVDLLASADDDDPTVDDGGYPVMVDQAVASWAAGTVGAQCGVGAPRR